MTTLRDENYLKQLKEKAENLKRQNSDYNTQLKSISIQNDFLEKTVQWFQIFKGLAKERDAKRLQSENVLFTDLVCNIFDKGSFSNVHNSIKKDQTMGMEPLIKSMDDIINDTESVYEFYNEIPIVQKYKTQLSEFKEKEAILKSIEEKNPILKKYIEDFNLIFEERNQLIVKMVTNSGQITYTENEIERISRDFNESLLNENELIKDLNKKIEELKNKKQENENNNKLTSKFTLSHIDIFKIPAVFPPKIVKHAIIPSKVKDNEHRNSTNSKKPLKLIPTFPILPLHRHTNNFLILPAKLQESKNKNIHIIENIQIKSGAELKSGNSQEIAGNTTISKYNSLKGNVIQDCKITNKETIKVDANDIALATIQDNTDKKNTLLSTKIIENNVVQQIAKKKSVIGQQTTKNNNISITSFIDEETINKNILPTKLTLDKYKFVDKSEIPNQKNMDLNKTKLSNINTKYYTESKICSPKKRFRPDVVDTINNNNKNKLVKTNNYIPSEKNPIIEISEETNKMEIQPKKNDLCKMDFAFEISSNESIKSAEICDFNFDGPGNMNFDDIVGNDNNFFGAAGGDLDFSSDNQFGGANCDSFKF